MIGQLHRIIVVAGFFMLILNFSVQADSKLNFTQKSLAWQQIDKFPSFTLFSNRDIYSNLDKDGRIVFATQVGKKKTAKLAGMRVAWKIIDGAGVSFAASEITLAKGMAYVDFSPAALAPGEYTIESTFFDGAAKSKEIATTFTVVKNTTPPTAGTISIFFPTGVPIQIGTYPITCGVPFPKGALYSPDNVQLRSADGKIIPCQTIARSRWGHSDKSSIRWLGLDFQATKQPVWDGKSEQAPYKLKFGPSIKLARSANPLKIADGGDSFEIDTGEAKFTIRKKGFNLFDKVFVNGKNIIANPADSGLYLVDQKGDVYRSANDKESSATIEERGPLRTVIRVEGWYVKDGATGNTTNFTLPTDKLCKFVTRLEFYAGKSYVRVLNTWIVTFDIFNVRLKDLGISIPISGVESAGFAIENEKPFVCDIREKGAYLIQHLHDKFDIESGGKNLKSGKRCAGWFTAQTRSARITISLNETWQRYPKEFEVLPDAVKLHIWPAHGKTHPEINQLTHQNLTRIIYAHEGEEMNLPLPWKYYLASAKLLDSDRTGVYSVTGQLLAGVHAGALGIAITSDLLIDFSQLKDAKSAVTAAKCFQKKPHALADPKWNCASLAAGYLHPYDPRQFPVLEGIIKNALRGYKKTDDFTQEYGMWIYRRWHHADYLGDGKWNLYRFNNTTHHHEALMPWLLYLRSGDQFYLKMGEARLRNMSDIGIIHYENNKYSAKEYHSHQKRLLGSTKHTNGFVPWGADHGVGGHLTSYDGLILAYYLTGDLRYKEVVVDEWQKTITEHRDNREYNKADRSIRTDGTIVAGQKNGARDVDCFVGELLELNMLTRNPKVLALLGPRLQVMEENPITDWGMPLHNVVHYYGSRKLRRDLTAFAKEFARTGAKPKNNKHAFWYYGYRQHEPITLASIINNDDKKYALAAYYCAAPWTKIQWGENIKAMKPKAALFYSVPDVILKYPHLMYACSRAGCDVTKSIVLKQPMLIDDIKGKRWSRILIKEDADQNIALDIQGISTRDIPIVVRNPDGKEIFSVKISAKISERKPIIIPKDGQIGVYSIFILGRDTVSKFNVPISPLPEIYCPRYWSQARPSRFFINIPKGWKRDFTITARKSPGIITNRKSDKTLAQTTSGEALSVVMPPDGIWFSTRGRYVTPLEQAIISVSPERWFAPTKELMTQPVPKLVKGK